MPSQPRSQQPSQPDSLPPACCQSVQGYDLPAGWVRFQFMGSSATDLQYAIIESAPTLSCQLWSCQLPYFHGTLLFPGLLAASWPNSSAHVLLFMFRNGLKGNFLFAGPPGKRHLHIAPPGIGFVFQRCHFTPRCYGQSGQMTLALQVANRMREASAGC